MRRICLLDCTLRDGGYVNQWHFGERVIIEILKKLLSSNVEYMECGYLSEKKGGTKDDTQYRSFDALRHVLPPCGEGQRQRFAVMIDYGQYDIEHIEPARADAPIIRVCFHKKDADGALSYCARLMDKGYTVFVQPMASLNFTDVEFVDLIRKTNRLNPACFYIVDSFGVIEIQDFQRILHLADHNLKGDIMLGYHAHNNLQQAYGNAKYMVEQNLRHDIVLDASVYGMGRGAGNLNMELFATYLNRYHDKTYNIDAFLDIMDEYLKPIFVEQYWGYSLPFYLSAQYNCHPNYAGYFADKNTLSNKSMKQLLASLPDDVKNHYSKEKAEHYYQLFQQKHIDDSAALARLKLELEDRDLLILAPGKSILDQREAIMAHIGRCDPIIIAINIIPDLYRPDYVFCANEKRLKNLGDRAGCELIISSNLTAEDAIRVNYSSYLSDDGNIADNPTLMLIRVLIAIGRKSVSIAGFDGYGAVSEDNYFDRGLALGTSVNLKSARNKLIKGELKKLSAQIDITFLTKSRYCD